MKNNYALIIFLLSIFSTVSSFGQTTVYSEGFTGQNDKGAVGPTPTTDLSGVSWTIDISAATLSASTDWFQVQNEVFEARDIDGEAIWFSPSIDISTYTSGVQFSLDASESGTHEVADYFITEYRINGNAGTWTEAENNGNLIDDFTSAVVSQTTLFTGNTLEIRVRMINNAGSEYLRLDNILVQGFTAGSNPAPVISNISISPMNPTSSDMVTVSADFTDADGIASATLRWGTTSGSLTNTVSMSNTSGDTYAGTIPAQANGTTVFYTVEATDSNASPETTVSSQNSYDVIDPIAATLPYTIDFTSNNPELNNWSYQSVNGTETWAWINSTGAQMNAFNNGCKANQDWLISPSFDLSGTSNEVISFDLVEAFDGNTLEVLYSTDYTGTGDPNSATWINTGVYTDDSNGFYANLGTISSSTVYFAFRYEFISGSCSRWTVENFSLQEGKAWTGSTDSDWDTATNWSGNSLPTAADDVIIPAGLANYPTASSATTINTVTIASGASLIAQSTFTADANYRRNLPTTNWYLVSSPVTGETIEDVIANHSLENGTVSATNLGLAPYTNNGTDAWTYQVATSTGALNSGEGYSIKLTGAGDASFNGTINSSNVNFAINTGTRNNFNLVGNPFTSYVNSTTFASANTALLTEETLWLWDGSQYVTYNAMNPIEVAPAQGFFVEAGSSGNVTFATSNQSHQTTDTFMRQTPKPSFELFVESGENKKGTKVFYIDGKTKGFDNGYDSKIFGGIDYDFVVFTQLLSNNDGRNLAIQTLPNTDIETMVVPLGLTVETSKEITFSVVSTNLPSGVQVYLEDRINNTFVNLSENDHTITTNSAINGIGQYYIHTTSSRLSNEDIAQDITNVSIYKSASNEITVAGLQAEANVKVFSLLGEELVNTNINNSNGLSKVSLPNLSTGVYVIKLNSVLGNITKKIILE